MPEQLSQSVLDHFKREIAMKCLARYIMSSTDTLFRCRKGQERNIGQQANQH